MARKVTEWQRLNSHRRTQLANALNEYENRKDLNVDPKGHFIDGVWLPYSDERQPCCADIKEPTIRYPLSLYRHCRSITHVANMFDVDVRYLQKAYRDAHPPHKPCFVPVNAYKAVHITPAGNILSCFDRSRYEIDKMRIDRAKENFGGGFYCFATPQQAQFTTLPPNSLFPTHIIRCEMSGRVVRYLGGKMAYSRCKPVEIVACLIEYDNDYNPTLQPPPYDQSPDPLDNQYSLG